MPHDYSNRVPANRSFIDIAQVRKRRYWCKKLQVSETELSKAVNAVGPSVNDVIRVLKWK